MNTCSGVLDTGPGREDTLSKGPQGCLLFGRGANNRAARSANQGFPEWPPTAAIPSAAPGDSARGRTPVPLSRVCGNGDARHCQSRRAVPGESLQLLSGQTRNSVFLSGQFARSHARGARKGAARQDQRGGTSAAGHCFPSTLPARRSRRLRGTFRSEEHTSELQSLTNLVCRLLLEKKKRT